MSASKDVLDLIQCSGNNFHAKVARWLSEQGWHVVISPYYMDQSQNKAREIDLVAEKVCAPITDINGEPIGYVVVRLFVECKFLPSAAVFWFAEKDQEEAVDLVCGTGLFRRNNVYTKEHHYLSHSPKVAKLFSTGKDKMNENEPIYKALNQSLNAMVSMRGKPVSIPSIRKQDFDSPMVLEFPVVVCNCFENVYSVDFYSESTPTLVSDNFQLEVRYAYFDHSQSQRDEYFLLDFVEFVKLSEFSRAVEKNATIAASFTSQ